MLTLRNFQKSYGDRPIITIPDWQLPPGIHWLKGPNGAGKTTLFRSIAGLLPHEGTSKLNNLDSKRDAVAYRMRINYAEAEPTFPPLLTAHEIIRWVADAKQAPAGQVEALIAAFDISAYMHTPVSTYSSGMLKKTSLIVAFLGKPNLILLDEPLVTLDIAATQTVAQLIESTHKQGVSFLLSSHQAMETAQLPIDSVWQVEGGKVVVSGER
ncbi:ABC transporter ATP-binding protein [Fibrella aquatilis]|uniref:ABC transporter ATP-binding protein n=1 Tax=Fibrella aquatilis TaxID=2817059 RepID=A0A939GA22_9BACT|nr:ABC transporter ATP-binding protein [Fibrella aquatilis]MBO0932811.1 ABC transporter ATP-binding protein [Fibrella aquatilis]